jgi:hypothetical protein
LADEATRLIAEGIISVTRGCLMMTAGELARLRDESAQARDEAQAALSEAQNELAVKQSGLDRLNAGLAEVQRRAGDAANLAESADGLDERLHGRITRAACAEESSELRARIAEAERDAGPFRAAVATASRELSVTQGLVSHYEDGLADPFGSDAGRSTSGYYLAQLLSGGWKDSPRSAVSRSIIWDVVGPSGVAAELQRDAIVAYISGDPAARDLGEVQRLESGTTLTRLADGTVITSRPRLSPQQAAEATSLPTGVTP